MYDFPFNEPNVNVLRQDIDTNTSNIIVSENALSQLDSEVVKKTGNQTIAGDKTFSNDIIGGTGSNIELDDGNITLSTGKLGIGTATPYSPLTIMSNAGAVSSADRRYFAKDYQVMLATSPGTIGNISAYFHENVASQGAIFCTGGTLSSSDERIKENMVDLSNGEAINKLKLIKPKRYNYIDRVKHGDNQVYGFSAQDIFNVIPECIKHRNEHLPHIYKLCDVSNDIINFNDVNNNQIYDVSNLEIGDDLRLFDVSNNQLHTKILDVDTSFNTIKIDTIIDASQTFVYGKEHDDFHYIKKDHLWSLTTASVIELIKRVETLEQQLANLQNN